MEISLSGCKWQVKGYWPFVPIKETSMELGQVLKGTTDWMEAVVPGGVHFDLYKGGYIENPYYGLNSLKCEWVENRWWVYRTEFPGPLPDGENQGKRVFLKLEGVDYEVMVYCNDKLLGEHAGMYEPVSFDVTGLLKDKNKLVLVFKGVPDEMGQIGYTSRTSTQKSRFNYKWDFSTRLVNIGIWKDVKLVVEEDVTLCDPYVYTDYKDGTGTVSMEGIMKQSGNGKPGEPNLIMKLKDPVTGETLETKCIIHKDKLTAKLTVENPKLWFPDGSGKQPLYDLSVIAAKGIAFENSSSSPEQNPDTDKREEITDKEKNRETEENREKEENGDTQDYRVIYSQQIGIRALRLIHNEKEHPGALPYTFVINGKRIYIKGVNITPLDHLYGNVTREQYRHLVDICINSHINLLRVWGGGLIEKEWLYEYCDQAGILIWQEFIQSSSGIDNKPCEDRDFLNLLERNSRAAILGRRNYTSLAVWSGGNELTEEGNIPCGYDNKNIALLKGLVETYDRNRFFFPTSASGPEEFVSCKKGVSHDVHGGWRYEGNPAHYEKYGSSDHLFHSEFGTDATPAMKSILKFLPSKDQYPTPMSGNLTWQHHGEWWGTYYRDTEMFGAITDLEEFTRLSQYMQTEGLRFMIEADRRRKYSSSGSIIWQMNEPWPNASCTNLMDYYGELKPAYYGAARAFRPVHVSVDYRKLDMIPGEQITFPITIHNSGEAFPAIVTAQVLDAAGTKLYENQWELTACADSAVTAARWTESWNFKELLFLRVKVADHHEILAENTYIFGERRQDSQKENPAPILSGMRSLKTQITCKTLSREVINEQQYTQQILLTNTGTQAAVQAGVELDRDDYWMYADDNYICLFPGEEKKLTLQIRRRKCGGFLEEFNFHCENTGKSEDLDNMPQCKVSWI